MWQLQAEAEATEVLRQAGGSSAQGWLKADFCQVSLRRRLRQEGASSSLAHVPLHHAHFEKLSR